jgi:hypothetical protein
MIGTLMRRMLSTLLVVSLSLPSIASVARGDASADAKAKADTLFKDGRALAKEEKWAEACPKFEESQKLDWATGTLLNLGVCHARIGKNAKAYAELVESLGLAQKQKRKDREDVIRKELAALEPKIARITVNVSSPAPSAVVTIDGEALLPATWGIAHAVDPGEHVIKATAPGRKLWQTYVTTVATDRKSVDVPELEIDEAAPVVATSVGASPASSDATSVTPSSDVSPTSTASSASSKRTVGFVVGGVGIAALGVGAFFGIRAASLDSQKSDLASQGDASGANDKADSARSAVTIARIGLGVGIVAVGVGAVLVLTSKGEEAPKTTGFSVSPAIAPGFGGFAFGGAW